jgi:hypothetical protein
MRTASHTAGDLRIDRYSLGALHLGAVWRLPFRIFVERAGQCRPPSGGRPGGPRRLPARLAGQPPTTMSSYGI